MAVEARPQSQECRRCCAFCDRVVHPAGCIEADCSYLYLYDDEDTGRRYMGCMQKVYRVEIDARLFHEAERTRLGYGSVRLTGTPLPQCSVSVERAYDGGGQAFDCVNPRFYDVEQPALPAFDLRDAL